MLSAHFEKESVGDRNEAIGTAKLQIDGKTVAEGPWRTQPGHFALCGEGLCVGRDSADPVSKEYPSGFPFTGGTITQVEIVAGDDQHIDLEAEARRCWPASEGSRCRSSPASSSSRSSSMASGSVDHDGRRNR